MKATLFLIACLVIVWPQEASAFYARGYFALSADLGGGGRLYYTGSPIERGWDCTACHTDAPGVVRVRLVTDPPELIAEKRYVPGVSYNIDAVLENETRGLDSKYNANGMLAEIAHGNDASGELKAGPGTELLENGRVVGSTSDTLGATKWSFSWTAPARGTGPVTVYLGAVDGNGAGDRETARQDHLGDDVYVARLMLSETPSAAFVTLLAPQPRPARSPWTGVTTLLLPCSVLLMLGRIAFQRHRA
jgi:hypothetical protein